MLIQDGVPSYAFTTLMVSGAVNTDAWDINNHGVIVGHYVAGNCDPRIRREQAWPIHDDRCSRCGVHAGHGNQRSG